MAAGVSHRPHYQRRPLMDLYSAEDWPYWPFTLVFTPSKTNFKFTSFSAI